MLAATLPTVAAAAPPDRIPGAIVSNRMFPVSGNVHSLAQAQYDRGEIDPNTPLNYVVMLLSPSPAQQADLGQLLADQQNPASAEYHRWLTPEEFAERFGLSQGDMAKISSWLGAQGLTVSHQARGRNWIAFSGTAGQTSGAFHTSIHRYEVNGESHFANSAAPQVPEALSGIVSGFLGLNDFHAAPMGQLVNASYGAKPSYTSGGQHFIAPADFATIYNLKPLQQSGLDGTGQSIAVVGQSDVQASDLTAFRTLSGLPANAPKMVLYGGGDPGFTSSELEGTLDLEWAGAIAPNATIDYVYGPDAFSAMVVAIEADLAPIISVSYGLCEVNFATSAFEALAQQANAQGITIVSASGDSGAAGCDQQGVLPMATKGRSVSVPAAMPEVTSIGGTQFVEGTGAYWSNTNSANSGSALSYIPEVAWNESSDLGLFASGGGASRYFSKPAWQSGPGVPNDNARDVPDLAFSAASHDGYLVVYGGQRASVYGTSCGTPSMAAIVALLNQYQISSGTQKTPGLGNINPQLYRLAQSQPSAFQDTTSGDTTVPCAQGSPDCALGSFGYPAGPAYDQATGLGSLNASTLFTLWNGAANGVTVSLVASPSKATVNNMIQATATVTPSTGQGVPSGSVSFSVLGGGPLGTSPLALVNGQQTASLQIPMYNIGGPGTYYLTAQYSGDAVFSSGGAQTKIQITTTAGAAEIVVTAPNTVDTTVDLDSQGGSWSTTFTLQEYAGVAALVTGFTMDGQAQSLAQYFPSPDIPAGGSLSATVVLRNVAAPTTHTFGFSGIDAAGIAWSRQVAVNYAPAGTLNDNYSLTATPLTVTQTSNPACQFPVQLNLNDTGGYPNLFSTLYAGTENLVNQFAQVFGTMRLQAWSSLQGTLCLNGITAPGTDYVYAVRADNFVQQVQVNFAPATANPTAISVSPSSIALSTATVSQTAQATLNVAIGDKTQPWTAAIYPANRTSGWLTVSQLSGTGAGQIVLTASGYGFEPGAYRAWIVIQSQNAQPQTVSVPIMFVLGAAGSSMSIASVANPASGQTTGAPGMLLSVFGTNLASSTLTPPGLQLPYSAGAVSATVNNIAAPLLYVSPNQINIQIPYEVGSGPAVLGISNNGQVAGFQFQIAPSAPAIYTDGNGNLAGDPTVAAGALATLYLNGAGDVTPALDTGVEINAGSNVVPVLPLSIAVGGAPALIKQAGLAFNTLGTTQVQFYVPANAATGPQPVVVTVNGVASLPVNVTVK